MVRLRSASLGNLLAISLAMLLPASVLAQTSESHTTVRHHHETVEEQPAEIAQAEDAIQKGNFTSAETLLKKAVERDPDNKETWAYQAGFDLGICLTRLGRLVEQTIQFRK